MTSSSRFSQTPHVLHTDQFSRDDLEYLFSLSDRVRCFGKKPHHVCFLRSLLAHKRAMLYFVQPSTRTFLSFQSACQILGIQCSEIRDPSTSSEAKGERIEDAIRTFSSYVDLIIMRSPVAGLCDRMATVLDGSLRPIPIINAGSGPDQHPTQSLLDLYTLHRDFRHLGGIEGKTICLVGDLKYGRTARSLASLLVHFPDVNLILSSPASYAMNEDILERLRRSDHIQVTVTEEFESILPECDAIYMTRLQTEWHQGSSDARADSYHLKFSHLKHLKKHALILHPFPRREEIDQQIDDDPRAKYWQQERNGMWIRLALIAQIFGVDHQIIGYADDKDQTPIQMMECRGRIVRSCQE